MAGHFEVIDVDEVDVSIEIKNGHEWAGMDYPPGTDFVVKPPLSIDEHIELFERTGLTSRIGVLLIGSVEHVGVSSSYNAEGEPGEEQVSLGVEMAKEILAIKGLRTAKVSMALGNAAQSRLVLVTAGAPDSQSK
jgi:hypothetical protein